MRLIGGNDSDDSENDELEDDLGLEEDDDDTIKKQQLVWDLMQSGDGMDFLAEESAKNCYSLLESNLKVELDNAQMKVIKMDVLDRCVEIINTVPNIFLVDTPKSKQLLDSQVSARLGLLVEELEFKYKILFNKNS